MGGYNVGHDDGTTRTPLISLRCSTLHTTQYCPALPYLVQLCLSFGILCREEMQKTLESIQRATRRDQRNTPEPMRGTHINTDQHTDPPLGVPS